jgi:hypothetical protein
LWRRILKPIVIFALILLIFVGLFIALVAVDENGYYLRTVLGQSSGRIVLCLLAVTVLTLTFLWRSSKLILDLHEGNVLSVEGHVNKVWSSYYRGSALFYVIGNLKFQISNQAYNALIEGTTYKIFYTPRSKFLVSIEPTETLHEGHRVSKRQENAPANSSTRALHASHLQTRVPRDRNPYLRRGLAWYFGLMLIGVVIGLVLYYVSQSPQADAGHRPAGNTQNTRTVANQK